VSVVASRRSVGIGLGLVVLLAVAAWIAGRQIRSPAQIAAETAAPKPGLITIPVERRVLSSEVIVRGTVRYGSPQPVVLAASEVKQGAGDSEIVTERPRRGTRVSEGTVAMSVSGRPVFVLRGALPSHRDIGPGSRGPDVGQLESALVRLGFSPGAVDGRYDGETGAAVAAWYESEGREPFGPTDVQIEQLRTANAAAAASRDLYLQARLAIKSAAEGVTPGEIAQARIDLETARDGVDTATLGLRTARLKASVARKAAARNTGVALAVRNAQRDNQLARAEVALGQATLNKARDALIEARRNLAEAPPGSSAAELAALTVAIRAARDDVAVARLDLRASIRSAAATRVAGRDAVATARVDRRRAISNARTAAARVVRAEQALSTARRQAVLADRRVQVLSTPGDTSIQRLLSESAAREAQETEAEASRLAGRIGIQVPANEVLFFPTLPLRVDSVGVRRGDNAGGKVMTVSNSRLAIDSSLSLNDAKLVRPDARVTIEEPDLGVRTTGVVRQVADRPGTHKVDPARVYLEVAPRTAPAQLVGASVKLTIAVTSTREAVLTVPVNALSVGADGQSRVQVRGAGGRTEYVKVEPGLAAQGLVEVRPVSGSLATGDLVVVGARAKAGGGSGGGP
jgi:peptidoglycan hydrolase-like protein with peptidoglycan-binding domain